ncbi:PIG-L family deacetylase [Streptomyces sp. NBC_01142]|uniref:PIG-L family deacetylase n=1 Tax=Streptomyces sp. NBC_01142 TaxID=2975865 RepID=UPI002259AB27|nr:PIG-L family deacetylase [Streptomyces sp. NBC_01142]MCX4818715.1 PIG-L family deacetylase [Streptomyces sp. NBC_01142]
MNIAHAPGQPAARSTGPSRRTVVTATAAVATAAALTSCSVPAPRRAGPMADPAPGMPIATSRRAQLMQILAHPDDDLYFMNPDTQRMLDSGVPLVCVYVTAGEANGLNKVPGQPTPVADKTAYSSARHQGLRQAYAALLGLPRFTDWQKGVATLRGDQRAEINTLANGARRVELIFLNLAMHTARGGRMGLPSLWKDRALGLRTVVADDSPVRKAGSYDYDQLVDVLVGLMDRYRPTAVHTLDPDPDIQYSDETTRKNDSEQRGYSDHADHTAVACFSWAAMVSWVAEATQEGGQVPAFVATSFRGYYNRHWPKNLPESVLKRKAAHLVPYGGDAAWECGNAAGCGDYNVGGKRPLKNKKGWVRSTHYRYPGARPAVAAEPDGRLAAYGVLGLRAVRWRETERDSGRWGNPDDLGGGPLAPALGAATLADGRQLLFGLRFSALSGHGAANTREIVLLEQRSAGGPFLAWQGLGNPERTDDRGRRIGVPVAVTAPDGRVHLFVRNADKGISTRVRDTEGHWDGWQDLAGSEIQDGLTTVVDGAGRIHVFGAGHASVHHWTQDAPGQPLTHRPAGQLPVAVDSPAALAGKDGRIQLLYRVERAWKQETPDDGRGTASHRLTAVRPDGGRLPAVRFDGYGPVSAATAPNGAVLLGRDLRGQVQLRLGGRLLTRTSGPLALDTPALHLGRSGATVVGLGADAHPWIWAPEASTAG